LLVALVLVQTAMSVLMPRGAALTIASDLIQGTLLLVATAAYLVNVGRARSALNGRIFWLLLSAGMVFWLSYQGMWNYFEVLKRQDVPDPFLGDIVLFLHLVPMIAALAVLPHVREDERDERVRRLDFTLLLTWWLFIYVYAVIPWQTVQVDESTYSTNFNYAYLTEKLVLLVLLAIVAYSAQGGWRQLYAQLLGASALYASSSYVANWAIGHKLYYSGSFYDIPLCLSIAWMAAVPLIAQRLNLSHSTPARPLLGVWITRLSMIALFTLLWAAMQAELNPTIPPAVKGFRITVSLLTLVVMGVVVFWRQRLLRDELSRLLQNSRRSFDELKALQEQLIQSEKLASLGQLVGGAAHEINNPLTAMLGYSDLLSASALPPDEQSQATQIGEEVRRTTSLVASLLTFARQAPARLASVDINSVLQTAVRLSTPQMNAEGISVRLELASSLPPVLADSNQILHVCIHLAGQVSSMSRDPHGNCQFHRGLFVRTEKQDNLVVVDFCSYDENFSDHSPEPLPLPPEFDFDAGNKPMTLSLNACCRIVEEHGGRLLQTANSGALAFRMELRFATDAAGRSFAAPARATAHGSA
jgi:signal transduction histidine kinase